MQTCFMAVMAGVLQKDVPSKGEGIVGATMLFLFYATFSAGWLGPSWLYGSEISPLATRSAAASLASVSNWSESLSFSRDQKSSNADLVLQQSLELCRGDVSFLASLPTELRVERRADPLFASAVLTSQQDCAHRLPKHWSLLLHRALCSLSRPPPSLRY
jgi:hypothetical protein